MVWASTKDLPNNRNYVVKNRQIKNGALAKLSPTLIIRNFEINWGILKDLLTFWPCLRVCLLAVIQNVRAEGGGEWNDWAGKLEQITPGPRSSLGLGQLASLGASAQDFVKIAQIARREAGPDQTGAVLGWVRSGVGGSTRPGSHGHTGITSDKFSHRSWLCLLWGRQASAWAWLALSKCKVINNLPDILTSGPANLLQSYTFFGEKLSGRHALLCGKFSCPLIAMSFPRRCI